MKGFFDESLFLGSESAARIYAAIKDLPIVDYHCHLDENAIAENKTFESIGELWLGGDHYKWRAMRLCGVDEHYITGGATWQEKFNAYAAVMPKLIGNPLYYWTHMELKSVFGITEPLNAASASRIWSAANRVLADLDVRSANLQLMFSVLFSIAFVLGKFF